MSIPCRSLFLLLTLATLTALPVLGDAPEEEARPIPIWQRPDYVVEESDIIAVEVSRPDMKAEARSEVNGNHIVGPDGFVTLGKLGRVYVSDMKTAECEEAIAAHLGRALQVEPGDMDVKVSVEACNSKEFHVVYQAESGGHQRIRFPYIGNETVLSALESCNGLASGSNVNLAVLRTAKKGKPVEMIDVNYEEALADPAKNLALHWGDTVLIRQEFRGEDLRPDGPVIVDLDADAPALSLLPMYEEAAWGKTASEYPAAVPSYQPQPTYRADKPKRVARTVFFKSDRIFWRLFFSQTGDETLSMEHGTLNPLIRQLEDEVSISLIVEGTGEESMSGCWLLLFGEEEAVLELHDALTEISAGVPAK